MVPFFFFFSAENGCFIKTRSLGSYNGEWINMVSNFNLTWKSSCLEILNYVRPFAISLWCLLRACYSSPRGLQDRLLKRGKLLWFGDSGRPACVEILPIDNGHRDKLQKRRIISLIGVVLSMYSPHRYLIFYISAALANVMDYASSQERTVS
jgi:hypothetical protein